MNIKHAADRKNYDYEHLPLNECKSTKWVVEEKFSSQPKPNYDGNTEGKGGFHVVLISLNPTNCSYCEDNFS